ncbi:MAG: hypothetical protein JO046_12020 [Solirubrobacterales bacterium]|nr:hypothetical protein [Solirubrobacterales bacterium]
MEPDAEERHNFGFVTLNPGQAQRDHKTIIVTGVSRSGTSMVARALRAGGVFMGHQLDDVVYEDAEVADALERQDSECLARLAAERNAGFPVWGFKRPNLDEALPPEAARLFRNPRFVVSYRDPVAIARRNRISEHHDEAQALRAAAGASCRMVEFSLALPCPTLLVSYEKALQSPEAAVDRLISFCGLAVAPAARQEMIAAVEPNREAYSVGASRRFEGYIDRVADGVVHGWCWQRGVDQPVWVDVTIDACLAGLALADLFRPDLAQAGIGDGCHGFKADVSGFVRTGLEVVRVRVQGRVFELKNSGRRVRELA